MGSRQFIGGSTMGHQHHGVLELLGAIEPPACLRPRDRLTLGLMANSDGVKGVDGLRDAALSSLAGGDTSAAVRCLVALSLLCVEQECSERLGAIGGHKSILRLMGEGGNVVPAADANRSSTKSHAALDEPVGESHASEHGAVSVHDREQLEGDEDEVQAAAALVAARVVASGCVFPMRASLEGSAFGRFPLQYEFVVSEDTAEVALVNGANADTEMAERLIESVKIGSKHIAQEETPPGNRGASLSVLVRPVKERQQSQFDVGFQMWPAAIILSRWLCRNPDVLRGRRVLEVGSGLGLAGLVAAHIADTVTLSDFNPAVLRVLEANAALNAGWSEAPECAVYPCNIDNFHDGINEGRVAIDTPGRVSVRHLDWDKLQAAEVLTPSCSRGPAQVPRPLACDGERGASVLGECEEERGEFERVEHGERFEVIIASDHICQTSDAEGTIRVLQTLLAEGGHAHFVVAHPRTRYGVDALVPLLEQAQGLEFTCEEILDRNLIAGLEEADYLAWLKIHVWWSSTEAACLVGGADGGAVGEAGLLVLG